MSIEIISHRSYKELGFSIYLAVRYIQIGEFFVVLTPKSKLIYMYHALSSNVAIVEQALTRVHDRIEHLSRAFQLPKD